MLDLYARLISFTNKTGPSSVKAVWLHAGMGGVYSAVLMSVAGVSVYVCTGRADATYWASCVGLWTSLWAFAGMVKKNQDNQPQEEGQR